MKNNKKEKVVKPYVFKRYPEYEVQVNSSGVSKKQNVKNG